jgi:hypothetical protein
MLVRKEFVKRINKNLLAYPEGKEYIDVEVQMPITHGKK